MINPIWNKNYDFYTNPQVTQWTTAQVKVLVDTSISVHYNRTVNPHNYGG